MTRHSNMVVFGTNTVVGLRVGTNATEVPSIDLGYTRQEAVLMPLVANTAVWTNTETDADGNTVTRSTSLAPCDMSQPVKAVVGTATIPTGAVPLEILTHPCLLVASNAEEGAKDSYSVLASFGAHFDSSSAGTEASAKGGLAQYFATGMAAQLLALNGGASVVAVSEAAKASAEAGKATLDGSVVLSPSKALIDQQRPIIAAYRGLRATLSAKVRGTKKTDLSSRFTALESAIGGAKPNILASCTAPDDCADRIEADYYLENYQADPAKFDGAVASWPLN